MSPTATPASPLSASLALLLLAGAGGPAFSQAAGGPTPSPPGAAVYFIEPQDGDTLQGAKATVRFGLRGMGVAPAGTVRQNTGHHHLIIDSELPPMDQPIPSDFNHLHFGAGQTEAEVDLAPGEHTLQLLLGDSEHTPHAPPVVSERIKVRVVEASGAPLRHASPPDAKVYFVSPTDGAYVPSRLTVHFGLTNMGVAPAGVEKANTGHHHLIIDAPLPRLEEPIPNDFNHLHFGAGQTEARITLPRGTHTLQLLVGDENHVAHEPPIYSKPITVTVTATGRRPQRARN